MPKALPPPREGLARCLRGYSSKGEFVLSPHGNALDLDVVEISWMDTNVDFGVRHNYFNVNRWLIDDLLEIMTTRRRAKERTHRMTHRGGNVWSFLAAPNHIVND